MTKPIVAITMGDAAGIGPEIVCKSLCGNRLYQLCNPVVLGDAKVIRQIIDICGLELGVNTIKSTKEGIYRPGAIDVFDYDDIDLEALRFGDISGMCGKAAVRYTMEAGKMAMNGEVAAMTSAPLNKAAMRQAGYQYEGQTQILGELTNSDNYGMLLILDKLRLMMYTTHMSLMDACKAVTYDGILKKIKLANDGLRFFDLKDPVIVVAALNPHAGEGGLFGREEIDCVEPAVNAARDMGINVVGPIPADTVFLRAMKGEFDLVLSLYHDHANLAMKLLGFGSIVTLLAGVPIIRTSTGHGTAFDIAGKNIAQHENMAKAIEAAAILGAQKIKQKGGNKNVSAIC